MACIISDEDINWLNNKYSNLLILKDADRIIIKGDFIFKAIFDKKKKHYLILENIENNLKYFKGYPIITDKYIIKITFLSDNILPTVEETGNRLIKLSNDLNIPKIDLHVNLDNTLCLIGYLDFKKFSLKDFIDGPVLQFFFDQSFFAKFGKWPRGQFSHGIDGLIENYNEHIKNKSLSNFEINSVSLECLNYLKYFIEKKVLRWNLYRTMLIGEKKIQGHYNCICGSNRKFRDCHPSIFNGLWRLKEFIKDEIN